MSAQNLKSINTAIIAGFSIILLSVCYMLIADGERVAMVVLGDISLLLLVSIGFMTDILRKSMNVTLYSYTNITLIGSIIFASVFALIFISYFISFVGVDDLSLDYIFKAIVKFPREFSYSAVFVIVFICILVGISNIALIRHEGFCFNNALSLVIACFYIGGAFLIYFISDSLEKYIFVPLGISDNPIFMTLNTIVSLFLILMLCYFECIFAGSAILGWIATLKKPSYDKDYIIILGCSIDKKGGLLPLLKGRVNGAIKFAWEQEIATGRPAKYVPSGGQGPNEIMSEGSAMEFYLLTRGAEEFEVFPEKKSTSTLENLRFSKKIIDELNPEATIAFATTNYHILRSGILAREAGFDAEGIASETKWYFWPNGFVREFFGILSIKRKAHITVAIIIAALCTLIGLIGYFGKFI